MGLACLFGSLLERMGRLITLDDREKIEGFGAESLIDDLCVVKPTPHRRSRQ